VTAMAARSGYLKLRDRTTFEFAVGSARLPQRWTCAANVVPRSSGWPSAVVATKPWRSPEAEAALRGQAHHEPPRSPRRVRHSFVTRPPAAGERVPRSTLAQAGPQPGQPAGTRGSAMKASRSVSRCNVSTASPKGHRRCPVCRRSHAPWHATPGAARAEHHRARARFTTMDMSAARLPRREWWRSSTTRNAPRLNATFSGPPPPCRTATINTKRADHRVRPRGPKPLSRRRTRPRWCGSATVRSSAPEDGPSDRPRSGRPFFRLDGGASSLGDPQAGLAAARRPRLTGHYSTPTHHHNAIEPHAIVVSWAGDRFHRPRQHPRASAPSQGQF